MKRKRTFLNSFKTKVTLLLILAMVLSAGLCNLLLYKYALDSQFNQLREKLMIIAQTAALAIDGDLLVQVPLNKQGHGPGPVGKRQRETVRPRNH